jgi:hypothetical protein
MQSVAIMSIRLIVVLLNVMLVSAMASFTFPKFHHETVLTLATSKYYRLLKFCYVPATSAAHNRLLFFLFFLRLFTVLMKQTRQAVRAIKQSIFLRCL